MRKYFRGMTVVVLANVLPLIAVDFHVTTAQELQNALTTASVNGAADTIYLDAGYYIGNFNFNSSEDAGLTVMAEPGVANTDATVDGAGNGRALAITCSGNAPITVKGLTFSRNCGSTANAALRISTGTGDGSDVLVEDCRLIGANSAQGIGLEVTSAYNATVAACVITRDRTSNGDGVKISDVTRSIMFAQNIVSGEDATGTGRGITLSSGLNISLLGNNISENNYNSIGGAEVTAPTLFISGNIIGDNCGGIQGHSVGGLKASGNTVTLIGNTFINNYTDRWGGGANISGNVSISNNLFSGNSLYRSDYGHGGGLYVTGSGSISANIFRDNFAAGYGGGVYASGTFELKNNTFENNNSSSSGGGAYVTGIPTVTENYFTGNRSSGSGGGASLSGTTLLSGNRAIGNISTLGNGGGFHVYGPSSIIINNVIAQNTQANAGKRGAGAYINNRTQLDMINNTITDNTSAGGGGGVAFQIDGVTEILNVYNNIIWGNTAAGDGGDVHLAGTGSRKEFMHNDAHDMYGVWDIAEDNIDQAPLFYDPVNGNYHQRFGSPTIDAGDSSAPEIPATDIDGETRVQDTAVDIGADEFNNTDLHPADLNDNWVIEESEYNAYAAAWKNDQSWSRDPNPVPADYVTRAGYLLENGGGYYNNGGVKPVCWKPNP